MRLMKSCQYEIHAFASKCSLFLDSISTASISASEVKLVLGPLRLIFGHFDTRVISKQDLNHFITFSKTASDDLKMTSEVKFGKKLLIWFQMNAEVMKCTVLSHLTSVRLEKFKKFALIESSKI
jgi:hypothetical protein